MHPSIIIIISNIILQFTCSSQLAMKEQLSHNSQHPTVSECVGNWAFYQRHKHWSGL